MCVGCRGRSEQSALLRVVAVRDATEVAAERWRIVPDDRGRAPGRGAYLHPDPQCLRAAIARRAFGRALRLPGGAESDTTPVQERIDGSGADST
ncbi:YlxR family protein [Ornithinimicrobium sp. Y1847]|uniref:YlxR family protein n=1 Tax=unclassified Ornithinimicrobium TaxID=2615080 RepID=UPI003B67EB77